MTKVPTPSPLAEERTLAVIGNLIRAGGFMGLNVKRYSLIIIDRPTIKKVKIKTTPQSSSDPEFEVFDSGKVVMKSSTEKVVLSVADSLAAVR